MMPFRRLYTAVRVVAFAAVVWLGNAPANADQLITLKTRPGVTQPILLWQPSPADPQVVLLLFPGAGGNVGFERKGGRIEAKGTYLLSHHRDLLVRPEVVVAVIDAPSDQPDMDSEFRRSAKHFEDMTAVARELKDRYPKARLVLLGHSRGTISAAYVAQALGDRVAAVILMAGFYERKPWRGVGLSEFDFGALKTPVLIVHHVKVCVQAPSSVPHRSSRSVCRRSSLTDPTRRNRISPAFLARTIGSMEKRRKRSTRYSIGYTAGHGPD